jgi:hypothetical protein
MEICKRICGFFETCFRKKCPYQSNGLDDTIHKTRYVELDESTNIELPIVTDFEKDSEKDSEIETRPNELADISEQLELVVKALEALEEKD